jgi:hypothetical protein
VCPVRGVKSSWIRVPAEISELAQKVQSGTRQQQGNQDYIVAAEGDQVFIYSLLKGQAESTKETVAQYRAPANIIGISCMGTCVCVGLVDGQVCDLLYTYNHQAK